jgi:hypothetical protein
MAKLGLSHEYSAWIHKTWAGPEDRIEPVQERSQRSFANKRRLAIVVVNFSYKQSNGTNVI